MRLYGILILIVICSSLLACKKGTETSPLFINSIVSTEIDFINEQDASSFSNLTFIEQTEKEMPDKRKEELIDVATYVFNTTFDDGTALEVWAHSDFEILDSAEVYAQLVCEPLGKLPQVMRKEIDHVVIHKGDEGAFGESEGHFFVLYSDNMRTRKSNNDLEETVFHEAIHASIESEYVKSKEWKKAQGKNKACLTDYAKTTLTRKVWQNLRFLATPRLNTRQTISSDSKLDEY